MSNPSDEFKKLHDQFKASNERGEYIKVMQQMKNIDIDGTYRFLLSLLNDSNQRMKSFNALSQYFSRPSNDLLNRAYEQLSALITDADKAVCQKAIMTLPRLRYRHADLYVMLFDLIQMTTDGEIKNTAINAISRIDGIPRQNMLPLVDMLTELSNQEEYADSSIRALGAIGFNVAYHDKVCEECGRGQREVRLARCFQCQKIICADHSYQNLYCSEDHYVKYNTQKHGSNPQYW